MIKKIKPAILILIQLLFLKEISGQISLNMTDHLKEKFSSYINSVPREEIYIHSDRDEYISGEDLWFNIYLIDRQSYKLSGDSKIAYFELLNRENRPIIQKRILLEGGVGPGQIILPDTLSTGIYTMRAYTSWMKNFLPYNCFIKDIKIYNSFSSKTIKEKSASGKISKERNSSQLNSAVLNSGLLIKADNSKLDDLEISVSSDERFRTGNNNQIYIIIQTRGTINHISSEKIWDETTKILIPKKQLSAGINQITIFNSKGRPVVERFIYTRPVENPVITIHSIDSLTIRNKISVDLEVTNLVKNQFKSSNLSVSVSPETSNHSGTDLNDYFVFGTEFGLSPLKVIKGKKISEIPAQAMDSLLITLKSNWIDWESILNDKMPVFKYLDENENHYLMGNLSTGGSKETNSDKFVLLSIPGKVAVFQYAKTDNEGDFSFLIHPGRQINDLIIQPEGISKKHSVSIRSSFSDQYPKYDFSADTVNEKIPPYISAWSVNNQVRKIYGTSLVADQIISTIPQPKIKRFYGKPETELLMKDYIALPVMQEVFFELLVGVLLKSRKAGYEVIVNDPTNNRPYETPPGLFVDGVLVKDPNIIAAIDPELVEKIDVVREKYLVGDYLFFGIINIITKAGNFSNVNLPDDAIRLPYRVVDPVSSFSSPDYSSPEKKKSRIPDFRNTMYWNPSVKPDKEGRARVEFWTSDFISDYEIKIQGVTTEGKPFSVKKIIKVIK